MAITKQLYELQELDNDIEHTRQTLELKKSQLGNREIPDKALGLLEASRKNLEDIKHRRRDAEGEVADITSKITETEKQLYSGRISNPKELTNLQHETELLKKQDDELETKTLEIIEQMEEAEKETAALADDYHRLKDTWEKEQEQLGKDIALLNNTLATLEESRRELAGRTEAGMVELYERIRKQKGQAVARVELGICNACRISLSAAVLQKARSGQPVQCGTCGRILFIA